MAKKKKNRAGLSASRKRSPMLGGGTLADYEAAARAQRLAGVGGGTLATSGRQTVAMTPNGTVVENRARRRSEKGISSTGILPIVVAEGVVDEVQMNLDVDLSADRYTERLVDEAERIYAHNKDFQKKIRAGGRGRDTLWAFMRHWLSSYLRKDHPEVFRRLPQEFLSGMDLRRRDAGASNRARHRTGGWAFYARRGSDSKVVAVSRELAEQIAESPAGTREDYLLLWLVPPFYVDAGEGRYRAEKGFVPVAWDYLRGKQELPEDFLSDPRAWLERSKKQVDVFYTHDVPKTREWSARNRAGRDGWVIYSKSERGYWSNEWGWTSRDEATVFNAEQKASYTHIPLGGEWRPVGSGARNRAGGIQVDEVTAPAAWASALVNGDYSGLDEEDAAALDQWLKHTLPRGWSVVDVARDEEGDFEPRFTHSYAMYGGTAQAGDVLDYVIHRVPRARRKAG